MHMYIHVCWWILIFLYRSISNAVKSKDYYTIALLGKTGQGKSTAGNKLLGIDGISKPRIKEWICDNYIELLKTSNNEETLSFAAASSEESVTSQCQMLSNEDTCIRVLDVPGFGDSRPEENLTTIQVNAKFVNAIVEVQEVMDITYNRIVYFLPFRGVPKRVDAYFQDELKLLFHYFGMDVFQCMVMIATQEERCQAIPFLPADIECLNKYIKTALKMATKQDIKTGCPPVVYLAMNATPKDFLHDVQMTNVLNDRVLDTELIVPNYSSENDWEEWIVRFEAVAYKKFKENDEAVLKWFKSHLAENLKCLVTCPSTYDYKTVKLNFEEKLYLEVFCKRDIPDAYSGEGDETQWERWIKDFEKKALQRKLDEPRKLQWLQARVIRGAYETVHELSSDERQSYALVKKALQTKVYATCFETRGCKPNEVLSDYAASLQHLATYAYPNTPEQEREEKVLSKLRPYLGLSIQPRKGKTVDEALCVYSAVNNVINEFNNDRSEGWDQWLNEFETQCKKCSLEESKYLLWFESRLGGKAMECFCTLPEGLRKTYEVAKSSFRAKLYQNSFEDKCKYKPAEVDVKDWAKQLSDLIVEAYPNKSQHDRDEEVIKAVLLVTETHIKLQPETVKEAVNFVCAIEKIPDEFTGTKDWCTWISTAERYLSHSGTNMTDHEKLRCIQTRMSGKAFEIFMSLTPHEMRSYDSVIECFQTKLFDHWLERRNKGDSEGWDNYVKDMRSLGERVYSNKESHVDQLILKHILAQLSEPHKSRKWKSLNEAINTLMAEMVLLPFSNVEDDWNTWKTTLESQIRIRCFNNQDKLDLLSNSLAGEAKEVFNNLNCSDYDAAIKDLTKKFSHLRKLKSRTKRHSETWTELHTDLKHIAADCYSSATEVDNVVFNKLCSIIKANNIDLCLAPESSDDAVLIVSAQEAVPNTFSGTENWETWIEDINKGYTNSKIPDDEKLKLRFLQLRLTGTALQLFSAINSTLKSYQDILNDLKTEIYKQKFEKRSKQPNETWKEFVLDLQYFGKIVYTNDTLDEQVTKKILVDPVIGEKVQQEKPKNVHEASIIAQAKEVMKESFTADVNQWDNWIVMLETEAKRYRLTDSEMMLWFRVSLTKDTRHECKCESYVECKKAQRDATFQKAFLNIKKGTHETVAELKNSLLSVAEKASPIDAQMRTLSRIKEIMQRKGVDYSNMPLSTLDEAVTTFTALEEMNYKLYKDGDDWELWIHGFQKAIQRHTKYDTVQWLKACVTQGRALEAVKKCSSGWSFEAINESISNELKKARAQEARMKEEERTREAKLKEEIRAEELRKHAKIKEVEAKAQEADAARINAETRAKQAEAEKNEALAKVKQVQVAQAKQAEEEKAKKEEARKEADRKAEEARKAADKKAEEARKEADKRAEEARIAADKRAEEARIVADKKAEEARKSADKKAEEEKAKKAEEARNTADKKAEEARKEADKRAEEARIAADKRAEEARIAADKKAEEARKSADKKAEEEKAKKAEEARKEADKRAEEARIAADKRAEDARKAADTKAEEARKAADKKAEDARIAADKKAEDVKANKADQARKVADNKAEEVKAIKADQARKDADKKAKEEKAEEARKDADTNAEVEKAKKAAEEARKEADRQADKARKDAEANAKQAEEGRIIEVRHKQGIKLRLISCTKCTQKSDASSSCHTVMVNPSETKSKPFYYLWKAGEWVASFFTSINKICKSCKKGYGTPGCTPIGTEFEIKCVFSRSLGTICQSCKKEFEIRYYMPDNTVFIHRCLVSHNCQPSSA